MLKRRLRQRSVESLLYFNNFTANKYLCNELEAKSIKFVLLPTKYVKCLIYLCCFSRSPIDEQFSNFATEV